MGIERIVLSFNLLLNVWARFIMSENIEQVQILFRHGERTPLTAELNWLKKPNFSLFEPYGLGQLTNKGNMQMYDMGQMLRTRYGKLLGETYRPGVVYARSSDYDRSINALQLVLAGIFPPTEELVWNSDLNWMPIPFDFVPSRIDNLFSLSRCPRYQNMNDDVLMSDSIQLRMKVYRRLINKLRKIKPNFEFEIHHMYLLKNLIYICDSMKFSLPKWIKPRDREDIDGVARLYFDTLSFTPEIIQLSGGTFAKRFIENMKRNGTQMKPQPKMYLYSGHEFNLYTVLRAHNVNLPFLPHLGSAIIVEKVRNDQNQEFVRMFYYAEPVGLLPVFLPCGDDCTLDQYVKQLKPILPSHNDLLCLFENLSLRGSV